MATTKIWPIHGNISTVLAYITNPEKTGERYDEFHRLLHYMTDPEKTSDRERERTLYITPLNCTGDPAESMKETARRFGKTGGVTVYHAYQSFKPGEVTPEQCHEIGVKLARKMWADRYQVVVTSHLDHAHLHNHICLSATSFLDGKKYNENIGEYYRMREASDELCREYGLSVIQTPCGKTPRKIREREKNGEPTKYSEMRKAITHARLRSTSWDDFFRYLHDDGYDFDPNFDGKYPKIKRISDEKWTRMYHCESKYDVYDLEEFFSINRENGKPDYDFYYQRKRQENGYYRQSSREKAIDKSLDDVPLLIILVQIVVLLLGGPDFLTEENDAPKYEPITPEMIETTRFLRQVSRQAVLMDREKLYSKEDVDGYLDRLEETIITEEARRKKIYNKIRNCKDDGEIEKLREEIHAISEKLRPVRREKKDLEALLVRCGELESLVYAEQKARHRKIAREYILPDDLRERWKNDLEDDGYLYGFEVKEEQKPARRKPVIYERPIEPERYYYDEPVRNEIRRKSKMRDDAR